MIRQARVLLVGAGTMAAHYARVMQDYGVDFDVLGHGYESARAFGEVTGKEVSAFKVADLPVDPAGYSHAVIATPITSLGPIALDLANRGVGRVLMEKPGFLSRGALQEFKNAISPFASVFIGYNRRFYDLVAAVQSHLDEDGGPVNCTFEFGERVGEIVGLDFSREVLARWIIANSSHVIDLATFLCGVPTLSHVRRGGTLGWHPTGAFFGGAGSTEKGCQFDYRADWRKDASWSLRIVSPKRIFTFTGLEEVRISDRDGRVEQTLAERSWTGQLGLKPGLRSQTEAFLSDADKKLCTLGQLEEVISLCETIGGYDQLYDRQPGA